MDPRLLKYARSARNYIIFIAITGFLTAVFIIIQDWLIAKSAAAVITDHATLSVIAPNLGLLALILLTRAGTLLIRQWYAHRAATGAIKEIRQKVLDHAIKLGPRWQSSHGQDTITTVVRALKDLDAYFVFFLPQLLLSVTVTPMTWLVILVFDWPSAVATAVTIPLIPLFMILIGKLTQEYSDKRLASMKRMGGQLLDLLAGLATLKALGREKDPAKQVKKVGHDYTRSTMATLRVAFMSGGVLEFLTTLCVAIVAVEVGIRLLNGNIDLFTGLLIIMLTPELFDPLRQVGKQFHASSDGVTAAESAFRIMETPLEEKGKADITDLNNTVIELDAIGVKARGIWAPADLSANLEPGKIYALSGQSGSGKTTTAMSILGLQTLDKGKIVIHSSEKSVNLKDIDPNKWWQHCAWVPQNPAILPLTVAQNLFEDANHPSEALLQAAADTRFDQVIAQLPDGWNTRLGQGGVGLSVGQRQRLALTRALKEDKQLIVLDEPTAHLDAELETTVIKAIIKLREQGKTVVVIAHRQAVINIADVIIPVQTKEFTAEQIAEEENTATLSSLKPPTKPHKPDGRENLPPLILNLDFADAEVQ